MQNMGFTLIEMMVTVAILAIVASFAVPSYQEYIIRGKLTEATANLADLRVKLEQYYQDNRNYGPTNGRCGDTNNDGDGNDAGEIPDLPNQRYFAIACTVAVGQQGYTASATSVANQGLGTAASYRYTLNEANLRQTTAFSGATGLPKNCWISKKAASC